MLANSILNQSKMYELEKSQNSLEMNNYDNNTLQAQQKGHAQAKS
jgi:hypothetical protein